MYRKTEEPTTAALDPATARKVMDITVRIVQEQKIPTMMITHNMGQALSVGNRTIMMDAGQIILDIADQERQEMTVPKLMSMYSGARGKELDNDRMLLSE